MPKFSIIIPTFDHGKLISFAVDSVLRQTETDWELFVIGDGSPQVTTQVLAKYQKKDSRIHFIPKTKGPRNGEIYRDEVIRKARGKYIVYLSDDDLFFPDHLAILEEQFKKGYN